MLSRVTLPPDPPTDPERRVAVLTHLGRREAVETAAVLIERLAAAGITAVVPEADVATLNAELRTATVVGASPEQLAAADLKKAFGK